MKNYTKKQRKKAMKSVKVGDFVTWGNCKVNQSVIEVNYHGVIVDNDGSQYRVAWDGNARSGVYHSEGGKGPIFLVLADRKLQKI